jgi:hypothetical protein
MSSILDTIAAPTGSLNKPASDIHSISFKHFKRSARFNAHNNNVADQEFVGE